MVFALKIPLCTNLFHHFFCDASGDGILAYLSGASYRVGAEKVEEFDEKFAPNESYGELLGHSIFLLLKRHRQSS